MSRDTKDDSWFVEQPSTLDNAKEAISAKRNIFVALILVASVALAGWSWWNMNTVVEKSVTEVKTLEEKHTELTRQQKVIEKKTTDVQERDARAIIEEARDAGAKVAVLQNDKKSFKYQDMTESDKEKLQKNLDALNALFAEGGEGQVPWYIATEKGISEAGYESWQWEFVPTYSFTDSVVDCIWMAKSNTGDILAFATSQWNSTAGVFENLKVTVTSTGDRASIGEGEE